MACTSDIYKTSSLGRVRRVCNLDHLETCLQPSGNTRTIRLHELEVVRPGILLGDHGLPRPVHSGRPQRQCPLCVFEDSCGEHHDGDLPQVGARQRLEEQHDGHGNFVQ